ncbi:PH domain-containing protein [Cellulomonas sp. Y8]|uniref:PH domain-containing protein n=1 Tax=Cellulomonas sp. Y8 TaxID=2591145 RepID=UPI003D72B4EF
MSTPEGAAAHPQPDAAPAPGVAPAPGATPAPGAAPVRESEPFEPAGVDWTPVSPRLASARLVVALAWLGVPLVVLVVVAALTGSVWVWASAALVAALVVWVLWLVPRQVRAMGYAERADDLLLRRGILFRSMVVVPYGRMQYVDVTAGPLARKLGIASVQLHTASPGTDASIDGLPTAEAARLRDQLASRGEARLAGL